MVRALRIIAPIETRMMLVCKDNIWRIAGIESPEGHINWTRGRARITASGPFEAGPPT